MKKPRVTKTVKPKKNLLKRFIDPRYITLTGKHDPLINRMLQRILERST